MVGNQPNDTIVGSYQLLALIIEPISGWQRTIPIISQTPFTGNAFLAKASFNICQVETIIEEMENQTDFHPGTYTLSIEPVVRVTGTLSGHHLDDVFQPQLTFDYDRLHFFIIRDTPKRIAQSISSRRHWKVGPGQKVGIVGLGGLGHMGVKFAKAFGAHVVLFTTSPGKVADGKRLGAREVVISTDAAQMAAHANSFDFILDAVSATHDLNAYLNLLKRDGNLTLVGAPEKPLPVAAFPLIFRRRSFSGSLIGGLPETQEMLDFCGKHNITCDIEMIRMDEINTAYERMLKSDVKYRFVIDMASFKSE